MGKLMFGTLEEQLTFASDVGLDLDRLKPQDVGIAFGAARANLVPASSPLADTTFEIIREEVLGTVPLLNK